ncbi:hypothetical protein IQ260_28235 [Leptolyngbya cf. ectocarpi LEGE 11479]|uniref:Inactive STAND domain-containing protein n=1 Tax=Leptolyngbya cf. ectocarpi LEGE 11479 TaxID=1828722 RepID=A0A929FDF3_LEPEC|nr:hypothetical protein [Leptolyngbya ectocarpi]MBE9070538.1 hypothetical protein [Leptolyngbya cf. ectocarpi LEGE 11479]
MEVNGLLIQQKEAYQKTLLKKYQAAYAQMSKTLSDTEKINLEEEIKQLETSIQATQREINELRVPQKSESESYRQLSNVWEEELHKINYSKVESALNTIFKPLKRREGSALFFIRKSQDMGGKWCIQKIKHRIQSDLGSGLVPRSIGFSSFQNADAMGVLSRLAERYIIDMPVEQNNLKGCTQAIIKRIIDSLESGQIFLLEIQLYRLQPHDSFLKWFVNDFWMPLVSQLPAISSQKRNIRLMAVLAVQGGTVSKGCLSSDLCCNKKNFNGSKIFELTLQRWTEPEICDWLFDFSGLTAQVKRLNDDQIEQMAENIHYVTGGIPNKVYHELMNAMTHCTS